MAASVYYNFQNKKKMTCKEMIIKAIFDLKDYQGSTRQGICKYLTTHFEPSQRKILMVNKLLNSGSDDGWLIRTKGVGANGHFRLSAKLKSDLNKKQEKFAEAKKTKKINQKKIVKTKEPSKKNKSPTKKKEVKQKVGKTTASVSSSKKR